MIKTRKLSALGKQKYGVEELKYDTQNVEYSANGLEIIATDGTAYTLKEEDFEEQEANHGSKVSLGSDKSKQPGQARDLYQNSDGRSSRFR